MVMRSLTICPKNISYSTRPSAKYISSITLRNHHPSAFISSGTNANLRYDAFYPRWAYDQYRDVLASDVQAHNQPYLDLWNAIPSDQFTDSPVHLTPAGSRMLAGKVGVALIATAKGS